VVPVTDILTFNFPPLVRTLPLVEPGDRRKFDFLLPESTPSQQFFVPLVTMQIQEPCTPITSSCGISDVVSIGPITGSITRFLPVPPVEETIRVLDVVFTSDGGINEPGVSDFYWF